MLKRRENVNNRLKLLSSVECQYLWKIYNEKGAKRIVNRYTFPSNVSFLKILSFADDTALLAPRRPVQFEYSEKHPENISIQLSTRIIYHAQNFQFRF